MSEPDERIEADLRLGKAATEAGGNADTVEQFCETVPNALNGERIDRLVSLVADVSRSDAAQLLSQSNVILDGNVASKGSRRVSVGSIIEVQVPIRSQGLRPDSSVEVPVVFEDDHIIVVDKPIGLVVHPGAGVKDATMVHGLLARYPELASVGERERPGIVHRLDKDTSGLLIVARTNGAYVNLVEQLKRRAVRRSYKAAVFGLFESDSGTIDAPIGRSLRDATRQSVVRSGRPAITHYRVREALHLSERLRAETPEGKPAVVSLLTCRLETGRTHQIRVHLASIDHPIVGDKKYGGSCELLGRPFLHAAELGFRHPADRTEVEFEAPLPPDLRHLTDRLAASEDDT